MQSFLEIQFPTDISYGALGGPEYSTDIFTSMVGVEQRNVNWHDARLRYNLAPAIKNKQQLEEITAFFRVCRGKAVGFRFKDWSDYKIPKQLLTTADGQNKVFQLQKKYIFGSYQVARKICKPVKDTIKIYLNGQLQNCDIDYASGKFSFLNPPKLNDKIFVEGEFDVAVRFDTDRLFTTIESYNIFSHKEIPLIELKL
jgi:uncharacterized protein (TIGR02217 family)